MMKRTFKLLALILMPSAVAAPVQMAFEVKSSDPSVAQLQADAFANRTMRNKAYLALTDDEALAPCWMTYISNREVQIKTEGRDLRIQERKSSKIIYELTFDPSHFEISGVAQQDFLDFCADLDVDPSARVPGGELHAPAEKIAKDASKNAIEVNIIWEGSTYKGGMPRQITSEDTELDY
jgi:hypothetical protein